MSVSSFAQGFLDKSVDARFKRDSQGRLVFFPWGFGTGRLVPDAAVEAGLRRAYRQLLICMFFVLIPIAAFAGGALNVAGVHGLGFFAAFVAAGFAPQLYPVWISRHLARADERLSYVAAMSHSLDRFSRGFLVFGLLTSILFALTGALSLAFAASGASERVMMVFCTFFFAPLALLYAAALRRNSARSQA